MSKFIAAQYVFDREGLVFRDEDAPFLNQLNYSFGLIKGGAVSGDHWTAIDTYKAFIRRHPHILPVLSVGGWGADGFSQAAATKEGRARFVQTALELMERHGFLGIDIDWEYPCRDEAAIAASPNDKENFTLLLQDLRAGLDALTRKDQKPRLLAAAFGAHVRLVDDVECKKIGVLLDQFNLMTYDLQTAGTLSYHAPLYPGHPNFPTSAKTALDAFCAAGIPKEKVMFGNAFYARRFAALDPQRCVPFAPAKEYLPSIRYHELIQDSGWQHAFDETACAAYATKDGQFATYDSVRSIACKGEFIRSNGLMGLMCWEYGGDHEGELTRAMYASLNP
ncbi:MAG: hypothetical protein IKU34_02490 [Clostridia bacterium]|nr:hypothetical protein [Clostridia bacterium]